MVKGISRQVIVIHPQNEKLFDQAIFILKDNAVGKNGITDEQLLKEAGMLLSSTGSRKKAVFRLSGFVWAGCGALVTGVVWLLTSVL